MLIPPEVSHCLWLANMAMLPWCSLKSLPLLNSKLWRREVGRQRVGGGAFRTNYTSVTARLACTLMGRCGPAGSACVHLTRAGPALPGLWRSGWLSCPGEAWLHGSGHSGRQRGGPSSSPRWRHQRAPCAGAGASHIPRGPPVQPCEVETAHSAQHNQTRPHFSHTE